MGWRDRLRAVRQYLSLDPLAPSPLGGTVGDIDIGDAAYKRMADEAEAREMRRLTVVSGGVPTPKVVSPRPILVPKETVAHYVREFGLIQALPPNPRAKDINNAALSITVLARGAFDEGYISTEYVVGNRPPEIYIPGPNDPTGQVLRAWAAVVERAQGVRPNFRV